MKTHELFKIENAANIPQALKTNGHFCLWKFTGADPRTGKRRKLLINPHSLQAGATNDRQTFAPLDYTLQVYQRGGYDGIGVGFFGGLCGIDIDGCFDEIGTPSPLARDVLDIMAGAYAELSPSKTGLHILCYAPRIIYSTTAYMQKRGDIGLEVYLSGYTHRYFTVTGRPWGRPADLEDKTEALQQVLNKYMRREDPGPAAFDPAAAGESFLSDADVLQKAAGSKNGALFKRLFAGDMTGYVNDDGEEDHSRADLALCSLLAFWCNRDTAQIDRIFRQSGLMRPKWDRRLAGTTYGASTIQKAVADCAETYTQPARAVDVFTDPAPVQTVDTVYNSVDFFLQRVQSEDFKPLPTGLQVVDYKLSGGFVRKTLVLLQAAPGMGKTALASLIFENMAAAGHRVLYFNFEMSVEQLIARSLSRELWQRAKYDISALEVLQGYRWTEDRRQTITKAAERFRDGVGRRLKYTTGKDAAGRDSAKIEDVLRVMEAEAKAAQDAGEAAPLIVIDYLQLLQGNDREDATSLTKRVTQALKDYAINHNTVVFAIGAQNRDSNRRGLSEQESGRDSSSIEYSADLMLGLAYTAVDESMTYQDGQTAKGDPVFRPYDVDRIRALRREAERDGRPAPLVCNQISLKVLKNRFGVSDVSAHLLADLRHSVFAEELPAWYAAGYRAGADPLPAARVQAVDLKAARGKMTKQAAAKKSGLVAGVISALEGGEREPTDAELQALAKAYGVAVDTLRR